MKKRPRRTRKSFRPQKFEIIEHTADIGLRSFGTTLPELFCHAAVGMFSLIGTPRPNAHQELRQEYVCVNANNQEELLIAWLSELLSLSDAYELMLREANIESLTSARLKASVVFVPKTTQGYDFHNEIKAVTYHNVTIEQKENGLQAEVFFDV